MSQGASLCVRYLPHCEIIGMWLSIIIPSFFLAAGAGHSAR